MNKHYNKTEDSQYRVVTHSDSGKFDTSYEYHDTLPSAEEMMVEYKRRMVDNGIEDMDTELWIESWDIRFKDWVEVEH